jgi:outer membrane receptor protein involved in Fe transport
MVFGASVAVAQEQDTQKDMDEVLVTGTRITVPGVTSSSPIYTVGAESIAELQQPEVEKIFRRLPIALPSDGQNANNGTAGAATIDLRGLGAQRNILLIDGKRITPYNFNGLVDTSTIPTAMLERVDILTGGASTSYGSDAMSGAINFIMKRDFEGVDIGTDWSQTGESDGRIKSANLTVGTNVAEGRGNIVFGVNWSERAGVQLGARPLGQLGIVTADGSGLEEFQNGELPPAAPAGCGGPGAVAAGGSTTTLPTRVAIFGGPALGQFRDDGTIGTNCSVFNFNPFNYYQTPLTRFGGTAIGRFEVNEHAEVYGRLGYSSTNVRQQIAPSGVFGSAHWTPMSNPLMSDAARTTILTAAEAGRVAGTVLQTGPTTNWRDINANNVVDAADYLNINYRRRTVEFGERSTTFDNNAWSFVFGVTGEVAAGWTYDVSYQRGESDRTNVDAGYSNLTNVSNALDSLDGVTCVNGDPTCVPLNLFGGFGSITPEMARYSAASAIETQSYLQSIASASISGEISALKLPTAEQGLALVFGIEYREEEAETVPDECKKLAPTSCLGGAGGNTLPIAGGFDVQEAFAEAILPVIDGKPGFQSLDLEFGYRFSDYNLSGSDSTWKYGLNWRPIDSLLIRGMKQRAARAPNVGELAAPNTSGLDNALFDPCSTFGIDGEGGDRVISAELRQRCIATGMTDGQVGTVEDIVSNQINIFAGTDLQNLPGIEQADTLTFGVVFTPEIGSLKAPVLSIDYYDIKVNDYIGTFGSQEILDACYTAGIQTACDKIIRVGGNLVNPGSGLQEYTTNLDYLQAEGLEISASFGVDVGNAGSLRFSAYINKYLTQESLSSAVSPVIDCKGRYGNQCGNPLPETQWVQSTTWEKGPVDVSLHWRHLGKTQIETAQIDPDGDGNEDVFPAFQQIDAFNYFDLTGSYAPTDWMSVRFGIYNLTEEDPPVVGNEAADTRSNSGNTFPSVYEVLGRTYSLGVHFRF